MSALIDPVRATARAAWSAGTPDPDFIGCVIAEQRGVQGPISLEVLLAPGGAGIEIGPFRLDRRETVALHRLLALTVALLAQPAPAPESGRGIAGWDLPRNLDGRAVCPPWEGETLP